MADLICPGYNPGAASGTAWDFASEATVNDTQAAAQEKADAKAVAAAIAQFPLHQCPHGCLSVPAVRFGKRGAPVLSTPREADLRVALAYTEWFLDVWCIDIPGVPQSHDNSPQTEVPDVLKPGGPAQLKAGDVIENRWVVLRLCATTATEDVRSGEIKILRVTCTGSCPETTRKCEVLTARRDSFFGKPEWRLVPHSEGGVTIRRRAEEPFDHYQCACLGELP
jgi:hypothetical protein